jgi:hypothetical protein
MKVSKLMLSFAAAVISLSATVSFSSKVKFGQGTICVRTVNGGFARVNCARKQSTERCPMQTYYTCLNFTKVITKNQSPPFVTPA